MLTKIVQNHNKLTLRIMRMEINGVPRYLVERTFPESLAISVYLPGANTYLTVNDNDASDGVTWAHS